MAPYDFRMWTELARGYEQAERFSEAETALKRALELAPNYAVPHW
jgi:Flp pilus assembly protein TadD